MNLHTENAQITADKMIARAKESTWTSMGIEVRENGRFVSATLRCTAKVSGASDGTAVRVTWHIDSKPITKALAVALLTEHYEATGEVPAVATTTPEQTPMSRQATYSVKPVDVPNFKSGNGFAVIDQDNNCPAVFANQADAYNWIDTETKAAALHTAIQLNDPAAPAFRRIEELKKPGASSVWVGYRAGVIVAKFWVEAEAIEWRAADPLNKGSIGELIDREELRKVSDYTQFKINTAAKLNAISPQPPMKQAYIFLTCECELHGFNRAATSVRMKDGKFEVTGRG